MLRSPSKWIKGWLKRNRQAKEEEIGFHRQCRPQRPARQQSCRQQQHTSTSREPHRFTILLHLMHACRNAPAQYAGARPLKASTAPRPDQEWLTIPVSPDITSTARSGVIVVHRLTYGGAKHTILLRACQLAPRKDASTLQPTKRADKHRALDVACNPT